MLTPHEGDSHPLGGTVMTVERSAAQGWMRVHVIDDAREAFEPIGVRLRSRGESELAERIQQAQARHDDAWAIAAALIAAYW
jgi:hypothetical protein